MSVLLGLRKNWELVMVMLSNKKFFRLPLEDKLDYFYLFGGFERPLFAEMLRLAIFIHLSFAVVTLVVFIEYKLLGGLDAVRMYASVLKISGFLVVVALADIFWRVGAFIYRMYGFRKRLEGRVHE